MNNIITPDLSSYSAQVIKENGRFALTYWPYCTKCKSPFQFDAEEPFAYCSCGTTEWGDPRPASWVCSPRQPLNGKVEMNDKTEQTVTDALRRAAKSAEPYLTATVGASHLNKAADTIDNLRTQLAEAQRDAEVNKQINRACVELPDDFRIAIELEPNAACVYLLQEDEDIGFNDPCEGIASSISAAIDAAKGETS